MAELEFREFAAKVAASLGMTVDTDWDETWNGVRIGDGYGRGYHLAPVRGNASRIEIRPVFPPTRYWFEDGDRRPITCSRERGPEAIAADITRRLGCRYEQTLAKIRSWDALRDAEDGARLALAAAIEAAFPPGCVRRPEHLQTTGRTVLQVYGPGYSGGVIRLLDDGQDVEFQRLSVPRAIAARIVAAFGEFCQPPGRGQS